MGYFNTENSTFGIIMSWFGWVGLARVSILLVISVSRIGSLTCWIQSQKIDPWSVDIPMIFNRFFPETGTVTPVIVWL